MGDAELKSSLIDLVSRFKKENAKNRSEEHIQTWFTKELLGYLGWTSANVHVNQPQEVKTGKKPDILLLNDVGNTIFVIESKEASKKNSLDGTYKDKNFVEQLSGYCEGEGLFWGVLTNFIEWRVYSRYQEVLYKDRKYAFHDLLWDNADKNDYIDLLSKDGLSFFRQLSKDKLILKKGRWDDDPVYYPKQEEIKEKFFKDLKRWRFDLRSYLSKEYKYKYDIGTIDLITQKILDRLIFIDYCADNEIVPQDHLHAILHSKGKLHSELKSLFLTIDERFNSELFAEGECDHVEISDEILRPIIVELSGIDFTKLSVHVIGEVYENYLAELLKSVKLGIKVEENKAAEKKKSQGIYYTPDFIVNFIVKNTVGEILSKCKSTEEIEKIRVLDPACGSGSFLIRVFDEFRFHYERVKPSGLFQFETKKKILQKNIFGVDLDERAVEITKLNLLVKALEGSAAIHLPGRKLLPNLKLNIRCGNSLVSGEGIDETNMFNEDFSKIMDALVKLHNRFHDINEEQKQEEIFNSIQITEEIINSKMNAGLGKYFKKDEFDVVKPFNYSVAFPEVYRDGGFDCVVGNPPYFNVQTLGANSSQINFIKDRFDKIWMDKSDILFYFIAKSIELSKRNVSLIVSNSFLFAEKAQKLRNYLIDNAPISEIVNFEQYLVFPTAAITTAIFKLDKKLGKRKSQYLVLKDRNYEKSEVISLLQDTKNRASVEFKRNSEFALIDNSAKSLNNKIDGKHKTLGEVLFVGKGMETAANEVFLFSDPPKQFPDRFIKKRMSGEIISRYHTGNPLEYLLYFEDVEDFDELPKSIQAHLLANKKALQGRATVKNEGRAWWRYSRPLHKKYYHLPKIWCSYRSSQNTFALDETSDFIGFTNTTAIFGTNDKYPLKYVLALLNSNILNYRYKSIGKQTGSGIFEYFENQISKLPIVKPDGIVSSKIISHVDQILKLKKEYHKSKEGERQKLQTKIDAIDSEIDYLVSQLYDLNEDEVKYIDSLSSLR